MNVPGANPTLDVPVPGSSAARGMPLGASAAMNVEKVTRCLLMAPSVQWAAVSRTVGVTSVAVQRKRPSASYHVISPTLGWPLPSGWPPVMACAGIAGIARAPIDNAATATSRRIDLIMCVLLVMMRARDYHDNTASLPGASSSRDPNSRLATFDPGHDQGEHPKGEEGEQDPHPRATTRHRRRCHVEGE